MRKMESYKLGSFWENEVIAQLGTAGWDLQQLEGMKEEFT